MFDLDTLIADCVAAVDEPEPRVAVKHILERAVADRAGAAAALPPDRAGIARLHVSDRLTMLQVVWAPGMTIRPHDHRTWASIAIYSGGEDNAFFRRAPEGLAQSGGIELRPGDACLLGDDTIHAVTNPTSEHAGAIHVYGGDFFTIPRSEWDPDTLEERPYDVELTLQLFEAANARSAGD